MKSLLLAATALVAFASSAADASVNIYISENAGGVLAQTIGSLNLTGLAITGTATSLTAVRGNGAYIGTGLTNKSENGYAITGPDAFGTGTGYVFASSYTGTAFALQTARSIVYIDESYVSGSQINSTATFAGQTFFNIELTPGTYNFATANDSIIVHIGEAAPVASAPEPASWAMMVAGFGLMGVAMRRRKAAVTFA